LYPKGKVQVLLFEPKNTLNAGNQSISNFTQKYLEKEVVSTSKFNWF